MRNTLLAARQNVHENEGMMPLLEAFGAIQEKRSADAHRLLEQARSFVEKGEAPPAYLGYCYLLLGDSAEALDWLQRAYELRDPVLVWAENIDFDVVSADPVTRQLLNLPGLKELYELRQRNVRASKK